MKSYLTFQKEFIHYSKYLRQGKAKKPQCIEVIDQIKEDRRLQIID